MSKNSDTIESIRFDARIIGGSYQKDIETLCQKLAEVTEQLTEAKIAQKQAFNLWSMMHRDTLAAFIKNEYDPLKTELNDQINLGTELAKSLEQERSKLAKVEQERDALRKAESRYKAEIKRLTEAYNHQHEMAGLMLREAERIGREKAEVVRERNALIEKLDALPAGKENGDE